VIRSWQLLVASLVVGTLFTGCSSTPPASKEGSPAPASSEDLPVKVTSLSPALEPYNPQISNQGVSAEQVHFTVSSVSRDFSCGINVLRSGRIVGKTQVGFSPPAGASRSLKESVPVQGITGPSFTGSSSNAKVTCREP
jgi:hypothetical protein